MRKIGENSQLFTITDDDDDDNHNDGVVVGLYYYILLLGIRKDRCSGLQYSNFSLHSRDNAYIGLAAKVGLGQHFDRKLLSNQRAVN